MYSKLKKRDCEIKEEIRKIKRDIRALPDGHLECQFNADGSVRWYRSSHKKRLYIKKKDRPPAEEQSYKKS